MVCVIVMQIMMYHMADIVCLAYVQYTRHIPYKILYRFIYFLFIYTQCLWFFMTGFVVNGELGQKLHQKHSLANTHLFSMPLSSIYTIVIYFFFFSFF